MTNTRRFRHIDTNVILGIVDQCRSYTTYAPITVAADGSVSLDLSAARTYFSDEVEEL